MPQSLRAALLNELGVVQYRTRSFDDAIDANGEPALLQSGDAVNVESQADKSANDIEAGETKVNHRDVLKSIQQEAEATIEQIKPEEQAEPVSEVVETSATAGRSFDLNFWRQGDLLVLESSREESAKVETKHRLINNVLKALAVHQSNNEAANGAQMHSMAWPLQPSSTGDDKEAVQWLRVFIKGQQSQQPNTYIWMMGDDLIELLLNAHGEAEDIRGTYLQDEKLGARIIATSSLTQIMEKPYLKASVWQLLRAISGKSA